MFRLIVLLAFLILGVQARAEEKTWLVTDEPQNSSYFAPKLRVSRVNDSLAIWPGVGIGWIVGSVVSFGFEGYYLANDLRTAQADTAHFSMAIAGLVFEAIPSPERRTHLAFKLMIGGGGAQEGGTMNLDSMANNGFLALEPAVGLEFNLTRNIRIRPEVSYLWISGDVPGMESKWDVSETAFDLVLRFKEPDGT
ncbi:MAG: hypothetical protein JWP91_3629 [Fibrobacteres bacterium]|nr:hypothetical protein [Fibrobacterota bacterium]